MIFLLPWLEYDSLDIALVYARGTQSDLQQAVETIAWV